MGVSTDGQICFGIKFEEGYQFQWDSDDEGIEGWWRHVSGYKKPFELYNKHGDWINGIEPPKEKVDEYYRVQRDFDESHPVPVTLVNYCSLDYPEYIIALPDTCLSNSRGFPQEFDPSALVVSNEARDRLIEFCKTYCMPTDEDYEQPNLTPKWYLSSYWG